MTKEEALARVKTGYFGGKYGFDMQLLVDAVGIIREMFQNGQISEVVRCKDCKHGYEYLLPCDDCYCYLYDQRHNKKWFCADGER